MIDVVNHPRGTGRPAFVDVDGKRIAGKTGTTQVKRIIVQMSKIMCAFSPAQTIIADDKIMDGRVNICLTLPSTQNTKRSLVTLVLISLLLVN